MSTPTVGQVAYDVPCAKKCVGGYYDKDQNDCPTCGYPNGTTITANWTGYTMQPFTASDDTAGLDDTDIACPGPKPITCPSTNPCCTYGTESAYGTCGQYESGQQLYRRYANNSPCVGDSYKQRKEACAPCTGGEWEYSCPTCGYPNGTTVTATLNKTKNNFVAAVGTGTCTTTKSQPCPATSLCPANCTGGKWEYTCPTGCGYGGGEVTATLTGYTPAVGTGTCVTSKQVTCPGTPACPPCQYTNWEYSGSCDTFKKKQAFTRSRTNSPCVAQSPDTTKSESCSNCEYGWIDDGTYTYTYNNPRTECGSYSNTCYCSYYKNQYYGVTTPAWNTYCPAAGVGYESVYAGEWNCGMENCPNKCYRAHPGAR